METDGRVLWVNREPVHACVTLALLEAFRRPETLLLHVDAYREGLEASARVRASEEERRALQAEVQSRRAELDRLLLRELRAEGEEAASIARVRLLLREELQQTAAALAAATGPPPRLPALDEVLPLLPRIAPAFAAAWEETDGETKGAIARALIRRVTVTVERDPTHRGRYLRTIGPTLFQEWLPWGEKVPEW